MIFGRSARGFLASVALVGGLAVCEGAQNAPASVTVAFDSLKVTHTPGHASRHVALRNVQTLPADGSAVDVDCAISRRFGRAVCRPPGSNYPIDCFANPPASCTLYPDPVRDPVLLAAAEIANGYGFDPVSLPGPADQFLRTKITVKLDPADLVALSPPLGAALLPIDAVNWQERAMGYPERDRELGVEGQASVACQIQMDGGLLCGDVASTPRKGFFLGIPDALERFWRAAPQLLDGTPSSGRWVQIVLTFKLAAPPRH